MPSGVLTIGGKKFMPRAATNPADKCTIFSIYPKEIDEIKPTITPGRFIVPAGTIENPSRLVVGPSSWWREVDPEQPYLEIPNSSLQVAESVVKDYVNGLDGFSENAQPGLFYIPGDITVKQLKNEYTSTLEKAIERQNNYWHAVINNTDIMWVTTGGNPLSVSGDARLACAQLGIENKDWMQNFQNQKNVRCVACGQLRNPDFPICPSCNRVVDKALAAKLGLEDMPETRPSAPSVSLDTLMKQK